MPSASFTRYMVGFMGQKIRFEILRGIIRHPYGAICKIEEYSAVGEVPDTGDESITFLYSYLFRNGSSRVTLGASNIHRTLLGGSYFLSFETTSGANNVDTPALFIAVNPSKREHFTLYNDASSSGPYSYHSHIGWSYGGTREFGVSTSAYQDLMLFSIGEQ